MVYMYMCMKVVTKTATEARNQFFDLIAAARYAGQVTVVVKNGTRTARIVPDEPTKQVDWKVLNAAMKATRGIFTTEDARIIRKARIDSRKSRFPEW